MCIFGQEASGSERSHCKSITLGKQFVDRGNGRRTQTHTCTYVRFNQEVTGRRRPEIVVLGLFREQTVISLCSLLAFPRNCQQNKQQATFLSPLFTVGGRQSWR